MTLLFSLSTSMALCIIFSALKVHHEWCALIQQLKIAEVASPLAPSTKKILQQCPNKMQGKFGIKCGATFSTPLMVPGRYLNARLYYRRISTVRPYLYPTNAESIAMRNGCPRKHHSVAVEIKAIEDANTVVASVWFKLHAQHIKMYIPSSDQQITFI